MPQDQSVPLPGIEHIVVLMLENRSFDNVLGWLYDPENAPPFDKVPNGQAFNGISGKNLSNPVCGGQSSVPVGSTTDTTNPYPDPGEVYQDVYGQLYNVNPPPAEIPPNPPQPPPMSGFVCNYSLQKGVTEPANIMNGFRPPQLINLCTLANQFVVCDHWFASVPSQTFTNRSFVHAGTASGYVNNELNHLPIFVNDTPTIYNLLEAQNIPWRIYYSSHWFLSMTFIGQRQVDRYMFPLGPRRMFPFTDFLDDAKNGTLPSYSFIEPIFMDSLIYGRENDMHPDAAILDWDDKPSDALFGDELVRIIYQALKFSPQWTKTLLVITFDEHGGCYDHVPPPAAIPPDHRLITPGQPGYSGFGFNRYGVRVPAVMVSPLLQAGAVDHTLYDHTSILRAVMQQFGVNGDLGQRTANATPLAPPFANGLRDDVPDLSRPAVIDDAVMEDKPHTQIQSTLVRAAAMRLVQLGAELPDESQMQSRLASEAELNRVADAAGLTPALAP